MLDKFSTFSISPYIIIEKIFFFRNFILYIKKILNGDKLFLIIVGALNTSPPLRGRPITFPNVLKEQMHRSRFALAYCRSHASLKYILQKPDVKPGLGTAPLSLSIDKIIFLPHDVEDDPA